MMISIIVFIRVFTSFLAGKILLYRPIIFRSTVDSSWIPEGKLIWVEFIGGQLIWVNKIGVN